MIKKPFYTFIFTFILFSHTVLLSAQDYLVDFTYLGSRTKWELLPIFGLLVENDIDLYKVRYKTLDVNMNPDTASGLLVLPQVDDSIQLPVVVYEHGTTTGPNDVPSLLKGGYEIAMAYAGFGFATIAPDYLGLGDARGFHPYLHAATEASASLDILFTTYEYLEFHDPDLDPNYLFLAGYSQGGHASMALHKEIDDFWSIIIPVTAATHMSGPYSLSGVMRDRILSDVSYAFPGYIAYIFLGYNEAYHLYDDIYEVFKEPYATSIQNFYNRTINLTVLNSQLISALAANGDTIVKRMLQDSIVDAIANQPDHILNQSLIDNDVFNWAPSSPTRLYYCGNDQQVPPRNSIVADSVMNALGAPDVEAINLNPGFDHGPCVLPAIFNSIQFFKSFLNTTGIGDARPLSLLKIYPNPSSDQINVDWEDAKNGIDFQIISPKGEIVKEGHSTTHKISVKELPAGIYFIRCLAENETRMARIYRQ